MAGGNSSTSRTSTEKTTVSTTLPTHSFSQFQYIAVGLAAVVFLVIVIVAAVLYNRYRRLSQTIEEMRRRRVFIDTEEEAPIPPSPDDSQPTQKPPADSLLPLECSRAAARPLWSPAVPVCMDLLTGEQQTGLAEFIVIQYHTGV